MLSRVFVALLSVRGLKKRLWRSWYQYLSRGSRNPKWTFMNYGYIGKDSEYLRLNSADESERSCAQLYYHVAGAVDLYGKDVLEVGSGRGGGASFIKRYLEPGAMVGVDLSQSAVNLCRRIHQVDGLEFRVGDAENLPFRNATFDAVVNVESSHCYPSMESFLAEAHRVLRPGGHLLHADFRAAEEIAGWEKALYRAGFEVARNADITPNVLAALDTDSGRKSELIHSAIPWFLRPSFRDFAAVRGSAVYDAFRSGRLVYRSFVLRKPL